MGQALKNIRKTHMIGPHCRERFLSLQRPESAELRALGVIHAGLSDLRGAYWMGRPDPGFHVLLYTLSGTGRLTLPHTGATLCPGEVLLAGAHAPYHYARASRCWRIAWLHFKSDAALGDLRAGRVEVRMSFFHARVEAAMEGWLFEAMRDGPAASRAAGLQVQVLAQYVRREIGLAGADDAGPQNRERAERLFALWAQVERDLASPWRVEDLAALMHYSTGHLHRLCLAQHGLPPQRMVARLRMQHAGELLLGTAYPLKQIAPQVGYSNEFAFSNAFKREMGIGPKAFRAQNSERPQSFDGQRANLD